MVSPAKTRTSGFSNLYDVSSDSRSAGGATRAARAQSKYAPGERDDETRRLRRIVERVKQALEPFYRAGRSGAIPTGGVPAAETIRAFLDSTTSASGGVVDLHAFRKCLYALGVSPDDAAFLLESLDRDGSGEMDSRKFAAAFLPPRTYQPSTTKGTTKAAGRTGLRRRFPGSVGCGSEEDNNDRDRDRDGVADARIEAFHRKVLERVLVKHASVQDAFRQYDTGRAGVLSPAQCRVLLRDLGFVGRDAEALLRHLARHDAQHKISFHAFASASGPGGGTRAYAKPSPKRAAASVAPLQGKGPRRSPERHQEHDDATDPIERIRLKLRQRVIGRNKSIREVFVDFDDDGNGHLDHAEFRRFMAAYGFTPDEAAVAVAFLDQDGSGTIDYDEFANGLLFYRLTKGSNTTSTTSTTMDRPRDEDERQRRHGEYLLAVVREQLEKGQSGHKRRRLGEAFARFDADGSGALDYREFAAFLASLGVTMSPRDLDALVRVVDADGSRQIEFHEFATLFGLADRGDDGQSDDDSDKDDDAATAPLDPKAVATRMLHDHGSLEAAFRVFDGDGSGELDTTEFVRLLRRYGVRDARAARRLARELDADGSGAVGLAEFLAHFAPPKPSPAPAATGPIRESRALRELKQVWVEEVVARHGSLARAFQAHDREDHGVLDYDQFRDLLAQCGVSDDRNVRALLAQVDSERAGAVRLDAFLAAFGGATAHHKPTRTQKTSPARQATSKQAPKSKPKPQRGLVADQAATSAARLRLLEEQWIHRALEAHGSVRAAFDFFDADASGALDHDEFARLLRAFGISRDDDIATMVRRLDVDASGTIDFGEFATLFHEGRVSDAHRALLAAGPSSPSRGAALAPLEPRRSFAQTAATQQRRRASQAARLRELELKWIRRALRCHASVEAAFAEYDRDASGALDYDEFARCMRRYGIAQDDDIARLARRLDLDGSGTIELHEFTTVFNALRCRDPGLRRGDSEDDDDDDERAGGALQSVLEIERELAERIARHTRDLRDAFRKFDLNGNGRLEYNEFRRVLKSHKFAEPEIRQVIRHLDRDVSGFIDYREFIAGLASATGDAGGGNSPNGGSRTKKGSTSMMRN